MKRGKLIVIEGSDGAGKTTQLELLAKYLKENGQDVEIFDFPNYDSFFGKLITRYLHGELGEPKDISGYYKALPYALDRFTHLKKMEEALSLGKIILCDRYTISNLAHQSTGFTQQSDKEEFWKWYEQFEYIELGLPREDLVIYLYIDPKVSQSLFQNRIKKAYLQGKTLDKHEEDQKYLEIVTQRYLELCELKSHWKKIICTNENNELSSIENIHQKVIELVTNFLKK